MVTRAALLKPDQEMFRGSPSRGSTGAEFESRLARLTEKYCALWWHCPAGLPDFGPLLSRRRQRRNRREIDRFTDRFESELIAYPTAASDQSAWLERLRAEMREFGHRLRLLGAAEREVIFSDDYFDATVQFVREAQSFDPGIEVVDLSQALRNVWVMHFFQLLLDRRVEYTAPILAYSLLYPYTDNRLDDPALPVQAKQAFCQRLERRLEGARLLPEDDHEAPVFRLVGRIEAALPRSRYPDVYRSLLAIHRAQTGSLAQQVPSIGAKPLCEAELLQLSVSKGGTSVLADGYLVAGDLSSEEADFFFGYGVFLQLADDLQYAEQDLRCGHATIFSRRARVRPLDHLANRLVHFLDALLASSRFSSGRHAVLRSLVRQSCLQLIVESAGKQRRCFSRRYLGILEKHSVTRFSYWRKQGGGLLERCRKVEARIRSSEAVG